MHRNYITIASVILGLTILLALFFQGNNTIYNPNKVLPSPSPSPRSNANIILDSPKDNSEISTSFNITGEARVFENTFSFRLKNARTGNNYAESSTITDAQDTGIYGKFNFALDFTGNAKDIRDGDSLILELFQHSPKDGTEVDKVTAILRYKSTEKQKISLFFPNSRLTKDFQCAQVFPVEINIEKTTTPAQSALNQLLKSPSDSQLAEGYSTNLANNLNIKSFNITTETAFVDLDKNISQPEKCKTDAAIAQIAQTLKQFPEIKNVKISINNIPLN